MDPKEFERIFAQLREQHQRSSERFQEYRRQMAELEASVRPGGSPVRVDVDQDGFIARIEISDIWFGRAPHVEAGQHVSRALENTLIRGTGPDRHIVDDALRMARSGRNPAELAEGIKASLTQGGGTSAVSFPELRIIVRLGRISEVRFDEEWYSQARAHDVENAVKERVNSVLNTPADGRGDD